MTEDGSGKTERQMTEDRCGMGNRNAEVEMRKIGTEEFGMAADRVPIGQDYARQKIRKLER